MSHQPSSDADRALLLFSTASTEDDFRILTPLLVGGDTPLPRGTGIDTTVAARDDGFAVTSRISGRPNFQSRDQGGLKRCDIGLPWLPTSVAPSANGYVAVGDGKLLEVSADCKLLQFGDAPGATLVVSAGEEGYLMVGTSFAGGPLVFRRTGPHFCD